ncbi:MAG TPA: ester cyclase [Ktedonobacteraceae bacterium]|jgi:predicted ester cyclase|nr:ester cyclase [Ktedonobacteraceae bacterium]
MPLSLSPDQRKALVRRYLETIWTTQEKNEMSEVPCIYGTATCSMQPLGEVVKMVRATFPDVQITIIDQIVEGEKVAVRWNIQGTDLGGYQGHLPTGRAMNVTGVTMVRFEQDILVEGWNEIDTASMLCQLGFVYGSQPPRVTLKRPGSTKIVNW